MKPLNIKNYDAIGHFPNSKLGEGDHHISAGHIRIFTQQKRDHWDTIWVHEKYDGSNVGIIKHQNQILALTRSGLLAKNSRFLQHRLFAHWVAQRERLFAEILAEGERLVGEWMAQAHGIRYKISTEPIVFFDYFSPENERYLQQDFLAKVKPHGLNTPRKLHEGDAITPEDLIPILNQKTPEIESVELPEGMVYRVERRGKVDTLAKWVRSDFKNGQYIKNVAEADFVWNVPPTTLTER